MEEFPSSPPNDTTTDERLVGMMLKALREQRGLALSDVVNETKIRSCHLAALEAGDYASIPGGEAYVKGFLRCYARALGVSEEMVLHRYHELRDARQAREQAAAEAGRPRLTLGQTLARTLAGGLNLTVHWLMGE